MIKNQSSTWSTNQIKPIGRRLHSDWSWWWSRNGAQLRKRYTRKDDYATKIVLCVQTLCVLSLSLSLDVWAAKQNNSQQKVVLLGFEWRTRGSRATQEGPALIRGRDKKSGPCVLGECAMAMAGKAAVTYFCIRHTNICHIRYLHHVAVEPIKYERSACRGSALFPYRVFSKISR